MDEVLVPQAVEDEGAVAVAEAPVEACTAAVEACEVTEAVADAAAEPVEEPAPT